MIARSKVAVIGGLALGLMGLCPAAQAQSGASPTGRMTSPQADVVQADMAMPDDLGAPLAGATEPTPNTSRTLDVATPIALIAANPRGRAILEQDMPGLCERPEFMMFKAMSPAKLAVLSGGRITSADLVRLQSDLVKVSLTGAPPRPHSVFTRGGQRVGRFSKAVYHQVVLMIASI